MIIVSIVLYFFLHLYLYSISPEATILTFCDGVPDWDPTFSTAFTTSIPEKIYINTRLR